MSNLPSDLISRQAAINEAWKLVLETNYDNEKVIEMLEDLPEVNDLDSTSNSKIVGKWLIVHTEDDEHDLRCAHCGKIISHLGNRFYSFEMAEDFFRRHTIKFNNFCKNCGEDMRGAAIEKSESDVKTWIIGIGGSDEDSVVTYRVIATKEKVKEHLLSLVEKDMDADSDSFEHGTKSTSEIVWQNNGVAKCLYAYSCFDSYHKDYTATPEEEPEVLS